MSRLPNPRRDASLAGRQSRVWRDAAPVLRRAAARYGEAYASRARREVADALADFGAASAIIAAHQAAQGTL